MAFYKPVKAPLRMVFLGCGSITEKHSKTLRSFNDVHLYYASRDGAKASAFSAKHQGKGFFESYASAIHSPEIDVVFIATPPNLHLSLAKEAISAGKHVIVEKPPFLSSADFDTIDQLRQKTGTQVFVAENYFYKPLLQALRSVIAANYIGDIRFLYFNATKTQKVQDWRGDESVSGGGALFEGGIHWINFISNLGLTVKTVSGFQPKIIGGAANIEKSMQVVVEYAEGSIGTLLYSWEVNTVFKGLRLSRIYGTRGSITFESNGLFVFVRGDKSKLLFPGIRNIGGVKPMFEDFFQALFRGEDASFTLAMARRDVALIEEAYKTAR